MNDGGNLVAFSRALYAHFGDPASLPPFAVWADAFSYLSEKLGDERMVLVIDEYPYAASANASLSSQLQVAIDRDLKGSGLFLVLCGSNVGFMEREMGSKSPLFGRRTAQLELGPFDYRESAEMLRVADPVEAIRFWSCLGGTPYYLARADASIGLEENVSALFFEKMGYLYEEPLMLLRQEVREPAIYNSVLQAVAAGANRPQAIADRAGESRDKVAPYLKTLVDLRILARRIPFGEGPRSRRGIYALVDPFFAFWYRFVGPHVGAVETGMGRRLAGRLLARDLDTYIGPQFEEACRQWLVRQARAGGLPIDATEVGAWWGADATTRTQTDVDALAADVIDKELVLGECKWRESFDESEAIGKLSGKAALFPNYRTAGFYLFTKRSVSPSTSCKHASEITFVTTEDLFA